MPFTVSHVAFVLPLPERLRLPLCGLVVGAMAPDLEYVVYGHPRRTISHSALGIVTLDLVLALTLLVGATLAAPGLGSLIPARPRVLRERIGGWRAPLWPLPSLARLVAAIVVGAASHVVTDGFTHAGSFPARHIPLLTSSTPIRGWTGAKVLQYGLSLIGILVIARVFWRWLDDVGVRRSIAERWPPGRLWVMATAAGGIGLLATHDQLARLRLGTLRDTLVLAFLGTARTVLVIALVSGLVLHPKVRAAPRPL